MTGNLALDLAISVGGIVVLVVVSYVLGGLRDAVVNEATAHARLKADEPDFTLSDIIVDTGGKTALAVSETGEGALVFRHGDRLATRRFNAGARPVGGDGSTVVMDMGEPTLGVVRCNVGDAATAAKWVGLLSGRGVSSANGVS